MGSMRDMSANNFFSLEGFAHTGLFENSLFVWDALERLEAYLQEYPLGKIECDIPSSTILVNPEQISIGEGCIIEPGAYIQGPCIIGAGSTVRFGAYIRGMVIAGKNCVIGHTTEIKHSILLNNVCAAHFNYVGDCILGNDVNLGAGVKCANLRLDHRPVTIQVEDMKVKTNLKKMGAIVGDGSQIGCNAVTTPGTLIGKNAICYPCISISGYIPAFARLKSEQKKILRERCQHDNSAVPN